MSGNKFHGFLPLGLLFAILLVRATVVVAQEETEADEVIADIIETSCLDRVGGLKNIIDKKLVNTSQYDKSTQILESNIPGPYRIERPTQPATDDLNPNRITLTVGVDGIITDAECI